MGTGTLTRQELYDKVWSQPVRTVARTFGISDVGLKKICRRHDIPTPGRGFWAKLEQGKAVKKTALPRLKPGESDVIEIGSTWSNPWQVRSDVDPQTLERERRPENLITIDSSGEYAHELVRHTGRTAKSENGADWLTTPHGTLDIRVSREQLERALRIMDALLTACEARGWQVVAEIPIKVRINSFGNFWHPKLGWIREAPKPLPPETAVLIKRQYVAFSIVELSKPAPPTPAQVREWRRTYPYGIGGPPDRTVPNGELLLEIASHPWVSSRRRFHDLERKPLESQLNAVITAFIRMAAGLREVALKNARERRQELLEQRRRREAERRQKELEQNVSRLQQGIERWQWRRTATEFLNHVRADSKSRQIDDSGFRAWMEWAEQYVERRGLDAFFAHWKSPIAKPD